MTSISAINILKSLSDKSMAPPEKKEIELIDLDCDDISKQPTPNDSTVINEVTISSENNGNNVEEKEPKIKRESLGYEQVQGIFDKYPGLFTFNNWNISSNVFCNVCKKGIDFVDMSEHVKIDGHSVYMKKFLDQPLLLPDLQTIIDRYPGIFERVENNSTTLWCNACDKETSVISIHRHVEAPTHVKNLVKALKHGVNYDSVFKAINDKVLNGLSLDLMYCDICDMQMKNNLIVLREHIESNAHKSKYAKLIEHNANSKKTKRNLKKVLADFKDDLYYEKDKLWCNKCETVLHNQRYKEVKHHLGLSIHRRNGRLLAAKKEQEMKEGGKNDANKSNETSEAIPQFYQDLANLFHENRIPVKRLETMKSFLNKYIPDQHVPDDPQTLRKLFPKNDDVPTEEVASSTKTGKHVKKKLKTTESNSTKEGD